MLKNIEQRSFSFDDKQYNDMDGPSPLLRNNTSIQIVWKTHSIIFDKNKDEDADDLFKLEKYSMKSLVPISAN